MKFLIKYMPEAIEQIQTLSATAYLEKRFKAVTKALKFLAENPRHPGLQTHEITSQKGPAGEKIFEAYAEQHTPGAYRIFFYYGSNKGEIVVFAVTPHP